MSSVIFEHSLDGFGDAYKVQLQVSLYYGPLASNGIIIRGLVVFYRFLWVSDTIALHVGMVTSRANTANFRSVNRVVVSLVAGYLKGRSSIRLRRPRHVGVLFRADQQLTTCCSERALDIDTLAAFLRPVQCKSMSPIAAFI